MSPTKANSGDSYWIELERSERRAKKFNEQFNTPCFGIALILVLILGAPCICYNKINKVQPENE